MQRMDRFRTNYHSKVGNNQLDSEYTLLSDNFRQNPKHKDYFLLFVKAMVNLNSKKELHLILALIDYLYQKQEKKKICEGIRALPT